MNIIRKARGTEISIRSQRVFLCYETDRAVDIEGVVKDLLSVQSGIDCVVSWLETPGIGIDEELLRNELQETQALVLWITPELLQSMDAGDWPVEYMVAKDLRLPIIPIANDAALFPRFTELAGAIHGIAITDREYKQKLKTQLESFLSSEELVGQIREHAFTATIFLSYRKMDIERARLFMKAFHDVKEFEAVSIWYDNFLTTGRVFSDEIRDSISNSDAFALLVTPNLLEKNDMGEDNYVVSTEYPFARNIGKPIAPVEAEPTDPARFTAVFPDIGKGAVSVKNLSALRDMFRGKLTEASCLSHMTTERAFLLGTAYLKGVGVERDFDRAIRLLEIAAGDNQVDGVYAAKQLAELHMNGIGTSVDYGKALHWQKKSAAILEQLSAGLNPNDTPPGHIELAFDQQAIAYNNCGIICDKDGDYSQALEWHHKALKIREKYLGTRHPHTVVTYNNIAGVYFKLDDYENAMKWYEKAWEASDEPSEENQLDAAMIYNNMGAVLFKSGDYRRAYGLFQKAADIYEELFGPEHADTAMSYVNLANYYLFQGQNELALEYLQKALKTRKTLFGAKHPDTVKIEKIISWIYENRIVNGQAVHKGKKAGWLKHFSKQR